MCVCVCVCVCVLCVCVCVFVCEYILGLISDSRPVNWALPVQLAINVILEMPLVVETSTEVMMSVLPGVTSVRQIIVSAIGVTTVPDTVTELYRCVTELEMKGLF